MNQKNEWKFLSLIVVIFIAACVETDIYLPAFADMMRWFQTTESAIQGLLTWNFVGICVSGPFYGPISDALGRKKPLLAALGLFLLGSLITVFANSFSWMLVGRIFQGLGSGGCFTLGIAILFDAFQKERAVAALNHLNTIIPIIMALAPLLGGFLNETFGFRSNFIAIALLVLLSLGISLFFFSETLPKEKRTSLKADAICSDFKTVLQSLPFWQLTFIMSLLFAGYIAFLSGSSLLFVVEFQMSKALFPFIQAIVLGGWVAGSLCLKRSIKKWGEAQVKRSGTILAVAGGVLVAAAAFLFPKDPYFVTAGVSLYAFGANWIIGLYFPEGMELFPRVKGIAASLFTSARLLISAFILALTSSLYNGTIYPLAGIVFGSIAIIFPLLLSYERKNRLGVYTETT